MNSILSHINLPKGSEKTIKQSLTANLSFSIKEVQLEQSHKDKIDNSSLNESLNSLCTVLEAIFIHGLKETFLNRVSQVIGGDPDMKPEPTFWGPLLIFSHRDIIDQINSLVLITTDVGKCRAWLRFALKESLLSSYLSAMRSDRAALKPYYRRWAYLLDVELVEVAQKLIEGIESESINLACNSSLLNLWTTPALMLAGLQTPPMRTCPITAGFDVAGTLNTEEETSESGDDARASSSSLSDFGPILCMNEDEVLKIILGTPNEQDTLPQLMEQVKIKENLSDNSTPMSEIASESKTEKTEEGGPSSLGNSLVGRVGWSSSFEEASANKTDDNKLATSDPINLVKSMPECQSYHSLLETYNPQSEVKLKSNYKDILKRIELQSSLNLQQNETSDSIDDVLQGLGYEILPTSPTSLFDIPEFTSFVNQLGKLATEPGLDKQNYSCQNCNSSIGINFGKTLFCSFSGEYFCADCHTGEEYVIPSRVIYNWDFRRHPVSKKSATFLSDIQHHPLIDLKQLNPRIYLVVQEMTQLQALRIQLNLLRAYLFTCREPIIEELQKRVWPREYLYERVHLYSLGDLLQIPSGILVQQLQKVVSFAKDHVLNCWLCSQKGFICELCNNPKVIYPFEIESTFRCSCCNAVFHSGCLSSKEPCPKCERRKKREKLDSHNS